MKKLKYVCFFICSIFIFGCKQKNDANVFPQAEYEAAYEQMIMENYSDAAKKFRTLTKKYSSFPEFWYDYGTCLMEEKNYTDAEKAFNRTVELYENSFLYDDKAGLRNDAMTSLGELYLLRKDFNKAKIQFEKCLALKNDKEMIIAIAATYIRLGYISEAEKYFSEKGIDIFSLN